jgi:acyl-CoA hydrolase/GNAT superfamily N-acetyltransferase
MKNNNGTKDSFAFSDPSRVMTAIEPGMNIFIGTGAAEPQTLVQHLMASEAPNLKDLTLIQLLSFGNVISLDAIKAHKYRLKTFYSGWVANEAIAAGRVDLIPSRFSAIPQLIANRRIPIDAVFIQISPPNASGYCSMGVSVDVAHQAIEQASVVVGEVTPEIPRTSGDTFLSIKQFDFIVKATEPPLDVSHCPVDDIFNRVAVNVASAIQDRSCVGFSIGPLFESLSHHLAQHRHLGIHTPFFTDAVMRLVESGAVSNRYKATFRGKSLASYAMGSRTLWRWLDLNPMVEFQPIDKVFSPMAIGRNPRYVSVFPARKVDLSGCIALHMGEGTVTSGPGQVMDFLNGAEISPGGSNIFALPSRNLEDQPNIQLNIHRYPNQLNLPDSVDMVATEYGTAILSGRSVRERAQALIEIAHPDDRAGLIDQAKEANILYRDQIFVEASARLYPSEIRLRHTFKNKLDVRFRVIKPSDEDEMRRLFYRFSDQAVYQRYFAPIKTMPHSRMQAYVNIDLNTTMSIVAITGDHDQGRIIAEARYVIDPADHFAEVAFVVDEAHQRMGIATYLYTSLLNIAKERGIKGFKADVLSSNQGMLKVFQKGAEPVNARLDTDIYHLTIPFGERRRGPYPVPDVPH